jgi:hypothetical protein
LRGRDPCDFGKAGLLGFCCCDRRRLLGTASRKGLFLDQARLLGSLRDLERLVVRRGI